MENKVIDSLMLNGTYENIVQINKGGGGAIFKAYHKRLQKDVVLKKIHDNLVDTINTRGETDILKNLRHSNLPQVLDFLQIGKDIYTVMDFIPGQSLQQIINAGYTFAQEDAIRYATQLCEALAYLHSQKTPILHCDIKPANIMVTPENNICLIDFNISGIYGEAEDAMNGYSKEYSSPEQQQLFQYKSNAIAQASGMQKQFAAQFAASSKGQPVPNYYNQYLAQIMANCPYRLDTRSDVYSFGATIFTILTGIKPKEMQADFTTYLANDNVHNEGLVYILKKATMADPNQRYANAAEMLKDFQNINKFTKSYKRKVRTRVIAICSSIVVVTGVAVGGLALYLNHNEKKQSQYDASLAKLNISVENADEAGFNQAFNEAILISDKNLGAYYYKLLWYYKKQDFKGGIDYINTIAAKDTTNTKDAYYSAYNYVLASCYFEIGEYNYSTAYFRTASENAPEKAEYYRDYAISCAKAGAITEAEEILKKAQSNNVSSTDITFIQAELAFARKDYTTSANYCEKLFNELTDEYLLMRTYMLRSDVYEIMDNYTEAGIMENIKLLSTAKNRMRSAYKLNILNKMVNYNIQLINITGNKKYYDDVEVVLKEIIDSGWGTATTYDNLYSVYNASGRYGLAKNVLLIELDKYNESYEIYKKLAFLELSIQGAKINQERNYTDFKNYYDKAIGLYSKANTQDAEMITLQNSYKDLQKGDWFR